jgi:fatty-acyl-CoA synthase
LIVEPRRGRKIDPLELLATLRGEVEDWSIPDQVVQVESMPLAATGKIDKDRLRTDYAGIELAGKRTSG